jgi:HlyD family secretion protein
MIPGILKLGRRLGETIARRPGRRARLVPALAVLGVLILALSLAFLLPRNGRSHPSDATEVRVTQGRFQPVAVLTGSLTALRAEEFKVPITDSYQVQIKWMVKEGESVKPGDPVVRFDTSGLASSIETAQDSLKAKREEKAQKEADCENQRFELDVEVKKAENDDRQKTLDASIPEGLESRYEYDRKQLEKKKSDFTLAAARTNRTVKLAEIESQIKTLGIEAAELEAQLGKLQSSLKELTLVAKTEGAVLYGVNEFNDRKVQVGDTVFATSTVATIPDLASLSVQAWISETQIQRIKAGQAVDLHLDSYPERDYQGVIREISKSAESVRRWGKSHYFRVDIEMNKLDPNIMKPGMSVRCEVQGPEYGDVLLVPLPMVAYDGRSFWVRPAGGAALRLTALDNNEFFVAARARDNPALKAGTILSPVGPVPVPASAREAKSDEKK